MGDDHAAGQDGQPRRGLIIVNTGEGKGKTTAALGTILRAWGHGMRVCVIQFIKSERGRWGEVRAAEKLGIDWHSLGDGWTWRSTNLSETAAKARAAWATAQQVISGGAYDLVLLDEFTYLFKYGWLDIGEVLQWLEDNRPSSMHLLITGRDAPLELLTCADLVTEMRKVKHPFDLGISGQPGIEF